MSWEGIGKKGVVAMVTVGGRYGAYTIGPEAFNLGGARLAALKIVPEIMNKCKIDCDSASSSKERRKDRNKAKKM